MTHWVDRKKSILGLKSRGAKIGPLRGWLGGGGVKAENGVSEIEASNRGAEKERLKRWGVGGKGAVFRPLFIARCRGNRERIPPRPYCLLLTEIEGRGGVIDDAH
jgi:hypothetical protein